MGGLARHGTRLVYRGIHYTRSGVGHPLRVPYTGRTARRNTRTAENPQESRVAGYSRQGGSPETAFRCRERGAQSTGRQGSLPLTTGRDGHTGGSGISECQCGGFMESRAIRSRARECPRIGRRNTVSSRSTRRRCRGSGCTCIRSAGPYSNGASRRGS